MEWPWRAGRRELTADVGEVLCSFDLAFAEATSPQALLDLIGGRIFLVIGKLHRKIWLRIKWSYLNFGRSPY
jgi:hypothetical protein